MTDLPPDTFEHEGPKCPYCGRQFTADDAIYYDEAKYTRDECDECGRAFKVKVHHSCSWTCEAIPDELERLPMSNSDG